MTTACSGEVKHLLVVEDTPVSRDILRLQLESAGFTVALAENGETALTYLRSRRVDLVLMDIQMSGMNGYEAARRIRGGEAGEPAALIPILAVTANTTDSCRELCLSVGMNEVILKPVKQKTLLEIISRYLRGWDEKDRPLYHVEKEARSSEPLAIDEALEEFGMEEELFRQLIGDFIREAEDVLGKIEAARKRGENIEVARLAHGLKGTAGLYFAFPLLRAAERVEKAFFRPAVGEAKNAFESLKAELRRVQKSWDQWVPR